METRGTFNLPPGGGIASTGLATSGRARLVLALLWVGVFVLLALVVRQAPLAQIGQVLAHLGVWQVAALAALNFAILLLMTVRLAVLLRSLGERVSLFRLVAYRLAGFGVTYFTPGPQFGGEPLQVHLLHRKQGIELHTAIASVFLDRLIDLLANFTFLAVGGLTILISGVFGEVQGPVWLLVPGLLILPLGHLAALWMGKRPATWIAEQLWQRFHRPALQRVVEVTSGTEGQIAGLCREKPRTLALVIGLAGLTWLAVIFEFWLTLRFLGVQPELVQAVGMLTAARLAYLLPLPAGLGTLEASQALATGLLGWDPAVGIAVSLVIRARDVFLAACGVGLGSLAYRKILFGRSLSNQRFLEKVGRAG